MAGSHSKSIIDSVENFWNTEMDGLSHDDNLKILTAGSNNMYSIAKCAKDLLDDKDGLKAYLTYQRLVKVLDFAFEGVQSLKKNTSESGLSTIVRTITDFEKVLDSLKRDLRPENVVECSRPLLPSALCPLPSALCTNCAGLPSSVFECLVAKPFDPQPTKTDSWTKSVGCDWMVDDV
ncbi:uncharacterized protein PV07_08646 [Cladophialophora immunda]|uniref:Uncharacterized protein n=1 Tax=Cladophialophora immunda TaxID=569365 RepID=A0A0D2C4W1_9EURO|nr:uncharacterized protein PV07_08646 [Cladophialophora immunda]KIW25480.1 hypothetical protein PV07_08646 [Cladophialophora immunda]